MLFEQRTWTETQNWTPSQANGLHGKADLVFVFGGRAALEKETLIREIRADYPTALMVGCSTSGEINGTRVYDDSLAVTAIHFEHTRVQGAQVHLGEVGGDSYAAGWKLAEGLPKEGLVHVMVFSEGIHVNGSELVRGLSAQLPANVAATGGLAGDGDKFERTFVLMQGRVESGTIAVIGFYGPRLKIGYGSMGGWDPFGPDRLITRAEGNRLYELDGQSALEIYKRYLGDFAQELPASALLFPLSLRPTGESNEVVRTILGIDEKTKAMIFAGDMPTGTYARFMKANFERIVDGAHGAAQASYRAIGSNSPELAVLISCVGRKLVLKQRAEDEIESVQEVFGPNTVLTGFYSYGEISPAAPNASCDLHNQTMTITTFSEN